MVSSILLFGLAALIFALFTRVSLECATISLGGSLGAIIGAAIMPINVFAGSMFILLGGVSFALAFAIFRMEYARRS